jgi:hypothetical protein
MSLKCQSPFPALIGILALACGAPTASVDLDATVHFATNVEGGCWSLVTPTKVYEPLDLPAAFRVEGLTVRVVLSEAPGWATTCYVGELVHVNSIRQR